MSNITDKLCVCESDFLGDASLGLGLSSLLDDRNPDTVNRSEGNSGSGDAASGAGDSDTAQAAGQAQERRVGSAVVGDSCCGGVLFRTTCPSSWERAPNPTGTSIVLADSFGKANALLVTDG